MKRTNNEMTTPAIGLASFAGLCVLATAAVRGTNAAITKGTELYDNISKNLSKPEEQTVTIQAVVPAADGK